MRRLIVNADDLGLSAGVNRGIADAVDRGVVTSTSLMVRWPASPHAGRWARAQESVSVGLHLDLGEWVNTAGEWRELYHVVDTGDEAAVAAEIDRQLAWFVDMVGRPPTHLDAHQHVHREEPARSLLLAAGADLGVPVREIGSPVLYCGAFYGQWGRGEPYPDGITFDALVELLDSFPPGTTELGCHPGSEDIGGLATPYRGERAVERDVLCDPRLPAELASRSIELVSYHDVSVLVKEAIE